MSQYKDENINIRVTKEKKIEITQAAEDEGLKVAQYLIAAHDEKQAKKSNKCPTCGQERKKQE